MNNFSGNKVCVSHSSYIFFSSLLPSFSFFPCRIILDRDTLFISSVLLEDQGVYRCVASTALDTAEAEAQLIVLGKVDFPAARRNCHCSTSLLPFTEPQ